MKRIDVLAVAGYAVPVLAVEILSKVPFLANFETINVHQLDDEGKAAFAQLIQPKVKGAFTGHPFHTQGQLWSEQDAQDFIKLRDSNLRW